MSKNRALGVCYYPEHWPEAVWKDDAHRMASTGIGYVRIGEFAWSRLEPARGRLEFDWLERAIETLQLAGLKVILGTPTATPPKWLVDEMPDMLPVDQYGQVLGFGSRRHCCFSHQGYQQECVRIVTALAERFGTHQAVVGWQVDNEYACHDTGRSWSAPALQGFRLWLREKYGTIERLNFAWGNVFWSMEYPNFGSVELPGLTPSEHNPAHRMDFYRYSSDQITRFNQLQVETIRKLSPGRDIIHNFMGRTLTFDHFKVGADLDISSWDCYPLGFLEDRLEVSDEWRRRFLRTGDPDFQAFHHDLYRATSKGRWWVMELQPGPVNWADHNPAPRDGMVRLWSWEAFAHGAEVVSYFRWRQAPFAQEQMHAGLLRPDSVDTDAGRAARTIAGELAVLDLPSAGSAPVAIIFDYASSWAWETQPQGREFDYFRLVFDHYRALRACGLSVDFLPPDTEDLSAYALVCIPGLFAWDDKLLAALKAFGGTVLAGPRTGSKTEYFSIPDQLPPDLPATIADVTVAQVESLPADCPVPIKDGKGALKFWREFVEPGPDCSVSLESMDGQPVLVTQGKFHYLGGWPDSSLMTAIIEMLGEEAGLSLLVLPDGLRLRRNGPVTFAFNYGDTDIDLTMLGLEGDYKLGQPKLGPSDVAIVETI
jgi:beta-galactosidase